MPKKDNSLFKELEQGLKEAIAFAEGNKIGARVYKPKKLDVRAVRSKTGLSQKEFAATFGIPAGTLRHWEQGERKPKGASLVLLNIIEKEPKRVVEILRNDRFESNVRMNHP